MRYLFRTSYQQDLRAWRHAGDLFWYGLLVVIIAAVPLVLDEFYVGEMGGVFGGVRQRRCSSTGARDD